MSIIDDLVALDLGELKTEHRYLTAVHDWAIENLGLDYTEGDRVEIISTRPSTTGNGWKCYSEALAVGRTGIAGKIRFNQYAGGWYTTLGMDRGWSNHERDWPVGSPTIRHWWGPADETPEGYEPPSAYDREHSPDGRIKLFAMPVSWVKKAASATIPDHS